MAYTEPTTPMTTTVSQMPSPLLTPSTSETLKILSIFMAPVYSTMGSKVTTKETISNKATIVLVRLSYLFWIYSGIVVRPILKYVGKKYKAAMTNAMAEVTSHAIMIIPFL